MSVDRKDLGAGLLFMAVAALYGGIAWNGLPVGQTLSMGPGYFPLVLCSLIAVIGAVLVVRSLLAGIAVPVFGSLPWRAIVLVSLAIVLFGTFLNAAGMFIAVAVTAFLCSMASHEFRVRDSLLLALGLALLCVAIFGYGVRLPIPVFGTWFTG
jgi:hypothetical protein